MRRLAYRLLDRLYRPVYTRVALRQYRRDSADYYAALDADKPLPVEAGRYVAGPVWRGIRWPDGSTTVTSRFDPAVYR